MRRIEADRGGRSSGSEQVIPHLDRELAMVDDTSDCSRERLTRWLNEARNGSRAAWDRLLSEDLRQRLLTAIMYRLPSFYRRRADPEDLLQETLLQAFRDIRGCRAADTSAFYRWLRSIADHRVDDFKRHATRQVRDLQREAALLTGLHGGAKPDTHTPSKSVHRRNQAARIPELLEALPERYRAVIVHRWLEGYGRAETATRMGLSQNHVSVSLLRALRMFRKAAREQGIDSTFFRPL